MFVFVFVCSSKVTVAKRVCIPKKPRRCRMIRVVVRNLDSMVVKTVMTASDDDVEHVQAKIQVKFDIPAASQKLVLRTVELLAGERLHHYTRKEQGA